MVKIKESGFDIEKIADSGQCFRMRKITEESDQNTGVIKYEIIARDKYVIVTQFPGCFVLDCAEKEYDSFWKPYFDIDTDTDYEMIRSLVDPKDEYLTEAVNAGYGIRILRQDLWEMIVTFLISQQNNIPRIHKCIDNICREYGEGYAFPTPESLAHLGEDDLMLCNLGYRSKYVVRAARSVAEGSLDLDAISRMDYPQAREELLKIYGVGAKVADCICLFGLHHLEAFPVDTHIKQVLEREYGESPTGRKEVSRTRDRLVTRSSGIDAGFPFERYGKYAGVIQQYIFYYELQRQRM